MKFYDIELHQGETLRQILLFKDSDKNPIDLTGCSGFAQVRESPDDGHLIADMGVAIDGEAGQVTLTITDAFETTVIQAKVQSGKFVMHVDNNGNRMGIMKATNKTIPSGKTSTFEIAAGCQVYIGDMTLEDYIRSIVNS
jgi:hypothetical protein